MKPIRVGGYARISLDDEGTTLGVQRQSEDIARLVAVRGWQLAGMYVDNNVSAYKRGIVRPEFERLMADLAAGVIDGMAVWDFDRLARQPHDLERLIELFDSRPLVFGTAQADIDLSTPDGRFMARLLVNFASKSSADTGRRVARARLQAAQQGKFSGGGRKPYGYQGDYVTINPDEANVVQDAAARVLAGESITSICHSYEEQGIPGPGSGNKWTRTVLKRLLMHPRTAGLRQYRKTVLLGQDGRPVQAEWEPLLDLATWEAVAALLTDKDRDSRSGRIDRKYLLSGFLRCTCGAKMYGVMKRGVPYYLCPDLVGCHKTSRSGVPIDEYVTEEVLKFLEAEMAPDDLQTPQIESSTDASIREAERSLSALIDEWTAGRISDQIFFTAQARKEAQLNGLKKERSTQKRRQTLNAPVGLGVRAAWAAANNSQRRAILSEVLVAIQVRAKAKDAPRKFDGKYYQLIYRTD